MMTTTMSRNRYPPKRLAHRPRKRLPKLRLKPVQADRKQKVQPRQQLSHSSHIAEAGGAKPAIRSNCLTRTIRTRFSEVRRGGTQANGRWDDNDHGTRDCIMIMVMMTAQLFMLMHRYTRVLSWSSALAAGMLSATRPTVITRSMPRPTSALALVRFEFSPLSYLCQQPTNRQHWGDMLIKSYSRAPSRCMLVPKTASALVNPHPR